MTDRSVNNASFTIEHTYDAAPAKVFAACASAEAKGQWFGADDEATTDKLQLDFSVGGREFFAAAVGGHNYKYEALYQDILTDNRIVATYKMWLNDALMSVSVATTELHPEGAGTRLTYTEQGAFLDGLDQPKDREHGTRELLTKALATYLKGKVRV
ncbi:MAG: SRPBCC domain-containing protein [Candidatus Baltobacteraceae bacterium]